MGKHSEDELSEVAQVCGLPSHGQVGVAAIFLEHSFLNSLHTCTPGDGGGGEDTDKMV